MASTGNAGVFRTPPRGVDVAPRAKRGTGTQIDRDLDRVRRLAALLDRRFVDPILGLLVPGAGDVVGSLLGLYIVWIAVQRRMSPVIVARMLMNLGVDALFGLVPLLGDLFDLGFRANTRNVGLLEERAVEGGRATTRDWLMVVGATLVFVAAIGLAIYGVAWLLRAVF